MNELARRLTLWLARRLGLTVLDLDHAERMYLAGAIFVATADAPPEDREIALECAVAMARTLGITGELDDVTSEYLREVVQRN
jgi:hypothetical protein